MGEEGVKRAMFLFNRAKYVFFGTGQVGLYK